MSSSIHNSLSASTTNGGTDDSHPPRGRLQVFLGYAAGVGKTYRMLEDAQHLKRQGKDIVVGYFEPHGRKDTIAKTEGLEMIPNKGLEYRGVKLHEMDTDAILKRHPAICVVDEFPHTNVPGSARAKRWEDVQVLLDVGIDVMTTMNIQHLESLNDQVFSVTGIRVRETVPDWLVKSASEVVMVDATTEALLNRLRRGVVYAPDKAQRAMENFFKESTLGFLRELALRQTAHELEFRGTAAMPDCGDDVSSAEPASQRQILDRILIYVTADPSSAMLIRRGRRMADYLGAECFAVCVLRPSDQKADSDGKFENIEKHLKFAKNLHIETAVVEGGDPAEAIIHFAHRHQITQILISRARYHWWNRLFGTDLILRIVREAKDVRVIVVAERARQHHTRH